MTTDRAFSTKPNQESTALETAAGAVNVERNDTAPSNESIASQTPVFVSLRFHAGLLDDIEEQRKRQASQLLALTRDDVWGLGLPGWHPTVETATRYLDELRLVEKRAVKDLELTFKLLPDTIQAHVANTRGLGVKSVARFLGVVGNPAWHYRKLRPRKLRELYAYCGLDVRSGEAPRNRRGEQSNWNGKARMRVYNMMEPCVKRGGPYRDIYDVAKTTYIERGDIDSKAHINNRAKRIGMKAIVKDLWTLFAIEPGEQDER